MGQLFPPLRDKLWDRIEGLCYPVKNRRDREAKDKIQHREGRGQREGGRQEVCLKHIVSSTALKNHFLCD
jgi:hypothetical protein